MFGDLGCFERILEILDQGVSIDNGENCTNMLPLSLYKFGSFVSIFTLMMDAELLSY